MLNVDMHVHTCYSKDSRMKFESLEEAAVNNGIDVLIITDHNRIDGALKFKDYSENIEVIIGEEIMTNKGEIIGLFLNKSISPGLSPEETIIKIKEQDGLIYIPHPFDCLRSSAIKEEALYNIISDIDIIEVFNSRNVFKKDNDKALSFANEYNILKGVGSDSHTKWEVGQSYIEIENFKDAEEFIINMSNSTLITKKSSILVHFITKFIKIFRRNNE
ncbi:MAG: PHP domain-containing protein [bacterium]